SIYVFFFSSYSVSLFFFFFFSSRRRHTRWPRDWSSDVCSSDLLLLFAVDFLSRRLLKRGLSLCVLGSPGATVRYRQMIMPRGIRRLHLHVSFQRRYRFGDFLRRKTRHAQPEERVGKCRIELRRAR